MEDEQIYELRELCETGGLSQESLGALIAADMAVSSLVRDEAAAMAAAKTAGLGLAERRKLRNALRSQHKEKDPSKEQPIRDLGRGAEVCTACNRRV